MKYKITQKIRAAFSLFFLFLTCSVQAQVSDSLRVLMHDEIDSIAHLIRQNSVDPYRGTSETAWNDELKNIHKLVDKCATKREYYFLLRRFGWLINDAHFEFPSGGVYNRTRIFKKDDLLFPVWVRIWDDGRVFVKSDLTNTIPDNSEIISINGKNAKDLALDMRHIEPSEEEYAKYRGNSVEMVDPYLWNSFIDYLFCEQIVAPFKVEYEAEGVRKTAILDGKPRLDYQEWYDNGAGKEIMEKDSPVYYFTKLGKDAISYDVAQDSIAIVKISSWIGSNILRMAISKGDPGFRKKITEVMEDVIQKDYPVLIVDIRGNIGGYEGNVSDLLYYFIDEPIRESDVYRVNPDSRKYVKRLLKESYSTLSKAQRKENYRVFENTPDNALFRSDTLAPVYYPSAKLQKKYKGEVYVLVDEGSYSASIVFAAIMKRMNAGKIAGTSLGGYSLVTSGNVITKALPFTKYFSIDIPFAANANQEEGYHYIDVDIPLVPSLESWKDETFDSLEQLLLFINNSN